MTNFHIMHAPGLTLERDQQAQKLFTEISDAFLHLDRERRGPLAMLVEILESPRLDKSGWTVILQDDAHPIQGWHKHLEFALTNSPRPILSLGHFGSYGKKLAARGLPYGEGVNGVWGYAWAVHSQVHDSLLDLARFARDTGWNPMSDDGVVVAFNILTENKTAMTSRALFDHDTTWKSTLGHGSRVRFPQSTIREPGPWWGSGAAGSIGTNANSPDVLELVQAWKEQMGTRRPGE